MTASADALDELLKTLVTQGVRISEWRGVGDDLGTNLPAIRREGIDVNLNDNPIFLTQKRLVHRAGVLAAILIAALIGLSLLVRPDRLSRRAGEFRVFDRRRTRAKCFTAGSIGVEILVLVIGGFSRISQALANERKAGLWDSNRLTPLKPWQLVTGYWFGSPLREFYMAVVLAGIGLVIVLLGRLSLMLWLGTQILIFSTALFFGLLAVLLGLVAQRPQGGFDPAGVFFSSNSRPFGMPKFIVTNFLLPIYGIANLFRDAGDSTMIFPSAMERPARDFRPANLSSPVEPRSATAHRRFLWRAVIRKTANPFQPLMLRWEAVAIFGILLFAQHGLIWGQWHGHFPEPAKASHIDIIDRDALLSIIHCGTMLLALIILAAASPQPESVRLKALRRGIKNLGAIFSGSAVSLALALAAVAAARFA